MALEHSQGRRHRRRPDGQRHRPCLRAGRLRRAAQRHRRRPHQGRRSPPSTATWRARSAEERDHRGRAPGRARRASRRADSSTTFGDCDLVIEAATENEDVKRKIFADALPGAEAGGDPRHQHLVDLDHAARRRRPTGRSSFIGIHFMNPVPLMQLVELIRGIATDDPTFEATKAVRHQARQDHRGGRGFPGLHRQPHPAADDQRGDLHALRGRRHGRGHRHRHAARRQPSDGAAASSPTSSASTPACRSCRCCTRAWPIPSTGPARCW